MEWVNCSLNIILLLFNWYNRKQPQPKTDNDDDGYPFLIGIHSDQCCAINLLEMCHVCHRPEITLENIKHDTHIPVTTGGVQDITPSEYYLRVWNTFRNNKVIIIVSYQSIGKRTLLYLYISAVPSPTVTLFTFFLFASFWVHWAPVCCCSTDSKK